MPIIFMLSDQNVRSSHGRGYVRDVEEGRERDMSLDRKCQAHLSDSLPLSNPWTSEYFDICLTKLLTEKHISPHHILMLYKYIYKRCYIFC